MPRLLNWLNRLDADIIKQGAWGWAKERRRRDDQISQPQLDPGFWVTNDGERIIISQSTSAGWHAILSYKNKKY